jgi:hypothetical protein
MRRPFLLGSALSTLALLVLAACGDDSGSTGTSSTSSTGGGGSGGAGGATTSVGGAGGGGGTAPNPTAICDELGLEARAFESGTTGPYRGDLADDFELPLLDGSTFAFQERFSGCETYLFVPDRIPVSGLDDRSVWEKDLDDLLANSPRNTHYFFVSRLIDAAAATEALTAMQGRIDTLLATLSPEDQAHWRAHLHVVAGRVADLASWPKEAINSHGFLGFGIDRFQRIRGLGYLSDVTRYSGTLASQNEWPWKNNLAYAANETRYWNAQYDRLARLEGDGAKIVKIHDGEILAEFAESDVELPSADELATFDTLEIEIEQACPDATKVEFGNCGAWDYLAHLFVKGDADENIELARFITAYHREAHWIVDASGVLPLLAAGGTRRFRWEFAPPWNTQPTATKLALRFSNRGKAERPVETLPLFSGGTFASTYNDGRLPASVPIPADAKRVELWSIVTGHGAEASQCAEFCNHEHELSVNGQVHLKEHPEAGTEEGCIEQLENGMVPNQPGTWWFGRGGWCPGQQVEPWIVDVTSDVVPGETAEITYRGLFGGMNPPDGAGNIVFTSYLVVHR